MSMILFTSSYILKSLGVKVGLLATCIYKHGITLAVIHHPSCSVYGTSNFCVHCEEQLQYKAEVYRMQMFILEVLPTTNLPDACTVEYTDVFTAFLNACYSPVCAVIDTPTSDFCLYSIFANADTCWLHTCCCFFVVPMS